MKHLLYVFGVAAVICWAGCDVAEDDPAYTAVLQAGADGAWDDYAVADPCVLYDTTTSSYKMYYAGCRSDGIYKIGYAVSTDGISWTKHNIGDNNICIPADIAGLTAGGVISPAVIKTGAGAYHMYFIGKDTTGIHRAGYASSADGLTWTLQLTAVLAPSGTAGTFDEKQITDIFARLEGTIYQIWYTGRDASNYQRIGYTTTATPTTIVRAASPAPGLALPAYGPYGLLSAHVVLDTAASQYWMWPTAQGTRFAIATAKSSAPGTGWLLSNAAVLSAGDTGFDEGWVGLCAVIKNPAGNGYTMWYTGSSADGLAIGHATSPDGTTWEKYRLE
ncbi:MAG: hypothetical protein ABIF71_14025 [Planctomycetota bacterium]